MSTTWTQERVGDSGTTATTSTPDTTWTTELIGAHIAGDSLTIDSIKIDGANIGHVDDTDILQFGAGGVLQVNGSLTSITSLNTNTIRNVIGGDVITFSGNNTRIVGDLAISGGNITSAITCDSNLTVAGVFTSNGLAEFGGDQVRLLADAELILSSVQDASTSDGSTGSIGTKGGVSIAKKLYVGTDLDVDGITNLDAVDIDGAVQLDGSFTMGVDGTGFDVRFNGDSAGHYLEWKQDRDALILAQDSKLFFHDFGGEFIQAEGDGDLVMKSGNELAFHANNITNFHGDVTMNDNLTVGVNGDGQNFLVYGAASGAYFRANVLNNFVELHNFNFDLSHSALGNLVKINSRATAGGDFGPEVELLRGAAGTAGVAGGNLARIKFTGISDDATLTSKPFADIYAESTGIAKSTERGSLYLRVNLGNVMVPGANFVSHASGWVDSQIGYGGDSLCTIAGDIKIYGNDIQSGGGDVCISMEDDKTTVHKLKATQCLDSFNFITDSATVKMTGDDQYFIMEGDDPVMKIGKANEANKNGKLELAYANGSTALGGMINLMKKSSSGTAGGNSWLWVDTSGKLRIGGTAPTTKAEMDSLGTIVGTQS